MARPRRPYNGVETIEFVGEGADDWWKSYWNGWRHVDKKGGVGSRMAGRWRSFRHATYRATNGLYDPLTYWLLVDLLASINPDIELRTNALVEFLNRTRDQFYWDVITVGKVLSDICDQFEDVLGEKNGLLERGKDYRGTFYRIHINGETVPLVLSLRIELMTLAEAEIRKRDIGDHEPRLVSPLMECPSIRKAFETDLAV